jgi:phospholipase C
MRQPAILVSLAAANLWTACQEQPLVEPVEPLAAEARAPSTATLTTDKTIYLSGEAITVTFANGPGNATDWVGVYPSSVLPGQQAATLWYYVDGSRTAGAKLKNGTIVLAAGSGTWPVPAGSWHAYFLARDGYKVLASAAFSMVNQLDPPLVNGGLGSPRSAIHHLITVIQENHSFDAAFGRYCTAPAGSNPACTAGPACCEAAPATEPAGASPIALTDAENGSFDPNHSSSCVQAEIHGGLMDRYVTGASCSNGHNFALATTPEAMYWSLAGQYALGDRYFHPFAGASSANDMYFARARFVFVDNSQVPGTLGYSCSGGTIQAHTEPTVADLLVQAGVSWATYNEGYAPMLAAVAAGQSCPSAPSDCPAHSTHYPCTYDGSDIPFAYYPSLHPDAGPMRDYGRLAADLAAGTLPAVSWVKPLGYKTEHPGSGTTISTGAAFVKSLIDQVLASSYASDTLILVTYDEAGGYFDHVSPPPNSSVDGQPYGARVPLLAVGRFARPNFVSHTTMEHSSIVKFIEWNWLGATGQLQTRDAAVNNLGSLLDPAQTGTPVPVQ